MIMPSEARVTFESNRKDVERLMEIHEDLAGDRPGRKHGVEVLNKSAIVLMCAVWEAYCEDLAAEAVDHLVTNAKDASALPQELRKTIALELKSHKHKHDLAVWDLADDGWKTILRSRLVDITERRNRSLNTPKSKNIDSLFEEALGLHDVSGSWHWQKVTASTARDKLDGYVAQRGDVAHRSKAASSIKKSHAKGFINHAERLVEATDERVSTKLADVCGVSLF